MNILYFTEVFVYSGLETSNKREREKSRGKEGRKEQMEGERVEGRLLLWFLSHFKIL